MSIKNVTTSQMNWGFEKDTEMVDDCPPECYAQQL